MVLDGVEVGPEAVVGEVAGAWALMDAALALERTGVDYAARAERWLDLAVRAPVESGRQRVEPAPRLLHGTRQACQGRDTPRALTAEGGTGQEPTLR